MGRVLIAGFTAALLLLGAVLVYLVKHPRAGRDVLDIASTPPPPPDPPPPRRPLPPPTLARAEAEPETPRAPTVARLSGQVLGGEDSAIESEALAVEVVDESGARPAVEAVVEGRNFQARLPPGTYTVTARLEDRVARVSGVRLNGRDVPILLVLQAAGALSGRVVPDGELPGGLEVRALVAGTRSVDTSEVVASDGSFSLRVAPGVYDVEVDGHTSSRLIGVQAPAEGLELRLQRSVVLKGAIGLPPGERCPIRHITLIVDGEEMRGKAEIDGQCRFETDALSSAEVFVRATGPGWLVEGRTVIPEQGEPPFLCLNSPCADVTPASLEVTVVPAGDQAPEKLRGVTVEIDHRDRLCLLEGGRCTIEGLPAGARPKIWAGPACTPSDPHPVLKPGLNRVSLICRRVRTIDAFVRQQLDRPPPGIINVRCGPHTRTASNSFVIRTSCDSTARQLEYSFERVPGWRSVALGAGEGPLLVELPAP